MAKLTVEEEKALLEAVPSLAELDGACHDLDPTSAEDRPLIQAAVRRAAMIIDEMEDASTILDLSLVYLKDNCKTHWNKGKALMRANLSRAQILTAIKGDKVAQIWAGKQHLAQSDRGKQDGYINKRFNIGNDLNDAKSKLDKVFGTPKAKRKHVRTKAKAGAESKPETVDKLVA